MRKKASRHVGVVDLALVPVALPDCALIEEPAAAAAGDQDAAEEEQPEPAERSTKRLKAVRVPPASFTQALTNFLNGDKVTVATQQFPTKNLTAAKKDQSFAVLCCRGVALSNARSLT
jgi:hypothetical protein